MFSPPYPASNTATKNHAANPQRKPLIILPASHRCNFVDTGREKRKSDNLKYYKFHACAASTSSIVKPVSAANLCG
jgi:hypothetical protein